MNRQIGTFSIDRQFIDSSPEQAQLILSSVIVVRAEMDYASDAIKYMALSRHFKEVEQSVIPHKYECILSSDEFGLIYKWHEVK